MCGIAGAWWPTGQGRDRARSLGLAMAGALVHRGPDAQAIWMDDEVDLVLGHSRLSIIDRSEAGSQPMHSPSGRFVVTFNGEIYNHGELRQRLNAAGQGPHWRGYSDTETLCAAIEAWGLVAALTACKGMFALAVWDQTNRVLSLARDRIGEKPLYYGKVASAFAFASELKALRQLPDFDRSVDPAAVAALLSYLYIPDPMSIHAGLAKLLPGHIVEVRDGVAGEPVPWWTLEQTAIAGTAARHAPQRDWVAGLSAVLGEVVGSQMLGDVPLGSFLSGGIDSSLITALMQSQSGSRVRTYSIGFAESRFNEVPFARAVASHLGTDHNEFILGEGDALALVPDLHSAYDEPFADSSQIPTMLLARMARKDITVALTGDGGDEVFGGYGRYATAPRVWRLLSALPAPLRLALAMGGQSAAALLGVGGPLGRALRALPAMPGNAAERLARGARIFRCGDDPDHFNREFNAVAGDGLTRIAPARLSRSMPLPLRMLSPDLLAQLGAARWMMGNDTLGYLPGDILVKVDRAAMAASLETRAPFLDERVLAFAWGLPDQACLAPEGGKRILRELLYRHVPRELVDRPKQGFSIPLDSWLRGPLRDWAEALLDPAALAGTGLLDVRAIRQLWNRHLTGGAELGNALWAVLMLQSWVLNERN